MNRRPVVAYNDQVRFVVFMILGIAVSGQAVADRADRPRKPSAPVRVYLDSRPVPGGYEVRLVAVPTRDVPAIELTLADKKLAFGATVIGQRRELVTRIAVRGSEGLDVVGAASADGRNKVSSLRLGAPRVQQRKRSTTIRTLPDGREIQEVR